MAHKYCLRCAGTCATYATQCMHCQHNFNQPFVSNKDDNRTIVLLLNQWRQGKTLTEIAESLKSAEIKPLNSNTQWSEPIIAHAIYQFTITINSLPRALMTIEQPILTAAKNAIHRSLTTPAATVKNSPLIPRHQIQIHLESPL